MTQEFMALDLSFSEERVPAIAGSANETKSTLLRRVWIFENAQTSYLFGFWSDTFQQDILWFGDGPENVGRRPDKWRAHSSPGPQLRPQFCTRHLNQNLTKPLLLW